MEEERSLQVLLEHPPKGFKVIEDNKFELVIRHRNAGMGCMTTFLLVWLGGWGWACVAMLFQYVRPSPDQEPVSLLIVLALWFSEFLVGGFFLYVLARRSFRLEGSMLTFEVEVFGIRKVRTVSKDDIRGVKQVKDGGEGDDSFPSWGLRLETGERRSISLLFRQPHESSRWLGQVLQSRLGVPFHDVPE